MLNSLSNGYIEVILDELRNFINMRYIYLLSINLFTFFVSGQPKTDSILLNMLLADSSKELNMVLKNPQRYRVQIIYTRINRNKRNVPSFKNYYYNYDPALYFNPASTVKLPLALLALEKLNSIHINGVTKYTSVQFDSSYEKQTKELSDSTSANGLPSIAHFIKKAFLVSDNDAYNRLFEFMGQQSINRTLRDKGYADVRITRQFRGFTPDQNRHTNQVRFINEDGSLLYLQPPAYNTDSFHFPQTVKVGKAYYNNNDSLINEPIDFTTHNNIALEDLQQLLQSVLFPSSVPAKQRFRLSADDLTFLKQYLSQYPGETNYPKYDSDAYYNSYVKFFFRHGSTRMPENVRVFNKVGWAYGFLTDVSYVTDFTNKVEFMLSATIYVNSDEILNDDKYDYETIGYPFLYQLGQSIYQHELARIRPNKPNLSGFKMKYETRSSADTRQSIKQVDN